MVCCASEIDLVNLVDARAASVVCPILKTFGDVWPFAFTKWTRRSTLNAARRVPVFVTASSIRTVPPIRGRFGAIATSPTSAVAAAPKPRIAKARGSPRFTAERSACAISRCRSGVAPFFHRRQTATSRSGWSLPMSFRLLATLRRTSVVGSSFSSSSNSSTGAGSSTNRRRRGAHGSRGRVPSETSRRTCGLGSCVHSASRAIVRSYSTSMNTRIEYSHDMRCVSACCRRIARAQCPSPWSATQNTYGM